MRHKHGYRKLGRTSAHRKALLKNLSIALITNGRIETTLPKAKELKQLSLNKKIQKYDLTNDRADVIDEALKIYIEIAKLLEVRSTNTGSGYATNLRLNLLTTITYKIV